MKSYPKISIVTPNYNLGQYLEQTILSIISQNYPNLEYIIIDGGSTDNSLKIIQKYEKYLAYWISEPDDGLYHAIQKGFEKSTGEIMCWLNSDDMLHDEALWKIGTLFINFPQISWVQGLPTHFNEKGKLIKIDTIRYWNKYHYYIGQYKWIQQESIFWRRTLWNKSGASLNTSLKLAGDYELWLRFFEQEKLYCTTALLSGFRRRTNQLSTLKLKEYETEVELYLKKAKKAFSIRQQLKIQFAYFLFFIFRIIRKLQLIDHSKFEQKILNPILGSPPTLIFDETTKQFQFENDKSNKPS